MSRGPGRPKHGQSPVRNPIHPFELEFHARLGVLRNDFPADVAWYQFLNRLRLILEQRQLAKPLTKPEPRK